MTGARYLPARAADLLRTSFRARLLLALVGSVALLLVAALLVVRVQTRRQVAVLVERAVERTNTAYREMEEARLRQLRGYAARFAGSNRLPAALDEASAGAGAAEFLAETALYELQLAGIPSALAAFAGPGREAVAAVLDGRALPQPAAALPLAAAGRPPQGAASHHRVDDRLFTVQTVPLALFGEPVGTLTLGVPLDDAVAGQLGRSVGAEVCFVAGGRCMAATPAARRGGIGRQMALAARTGARRRIRWNGVRMALVPERLAGGGADGVSRVVAVPLEDVLTPFDQLERAQAAAGAVALLVALALGAVLSRSFAQPVRALVAATRRVAAGDLETRVEVARRDELGTLAGAFNEMAHGLMLKERYRGVLDKVVSREVAAELLKGEIRLGGETREVTTLFADVRGFTPLTEGMEPAQVILLLNEMVGRMGGAVEAEGGVVDKFLGDGLMAIFGAPGAQPDHAARAVRAALGVRDAVAGVNAARAAREEVPVHVGIGANTGRAVAGNVGSPGRLNYTVVGESVNVASRLCAQAAAGEILISQTTWERVKDQVDAEPAGERTVKGLSAAVAVFRVRGLRTPRPGARPALGAIAVSAGLACAPAAAAQPLPTLAELGWTWTSPGGAVQVTSGGRLELEASLPRAERAWQVPGTEPAFQPRLALSADAFAGSRWYAAVEVRAERAEARGAGEVSVRVEQALVRWTPFVGFAVQAGQFVTPFGAYPQRHHTPADPFIRPPLPYDHRTMVSAARVPGGPAGFLGWKDAPEVHRPEGAPPVWAAPYPSGAMVMVRAGPVDARAAVLNSAPSAERRHWRFRPGEQAPSFAAAVAIEPVAEVRVGASYYRGPYLQPEPAGAALPEGRGWDDYHQELVSLNAAFARGRVQARVEAIFDRWEVPNVSSRVRDVSWSAEAKARLSASLYVAARAGAIGFGKVDAGTRREAWDYGAARTELAAGLRLGRNTELRAEYLRLWTDAPPAGDDHAFLVRWGWVF